MSATRFYLITLGVPLLLAVLLFCTFDLTNLDVLISNHFYDPLTKTFVLQHDRLFEKLTHKLPRILPNSLGELSVIGMVLSFAWTLLPKGRFTAWLEQVRVAPVLRWFVAHRRDFIFLVVSIAITTGMVHYFKSHTSVWCPVETTLYGGVHEKREWFENFSLLHEAGEGRCWPGGHASSGFTLLALYFVARRYRWQHARKLFIAVMTIGMIYGTTRVPQGWHFVSHTFWSAILVWLTMLGTALAFYGRERLSQPALGAIRQTPESVAEGISVSAR
ncbi:phosphatase PAP2 family protein [Pseudomonas sp. LA21]|uniref:phosphatase PAP2 family protein n=1 Tax=unclassified Pseudomonas TaxID=196821 RepID=UPI001FB5B4D7|nr:phosphatase PAP2 family protein [Pseudomonas sp. LA21]MCJ1884250.1 phosphatase PAP2 family protein [Pseudomonas sp. LA21]